MAKLNIGLLKTNTAEKDNYPESWSPQRAFYEETSQKPGREKSWDEKPTEWEEISGVKKEF